MESKQHKPIWVNPMLDPAFRALFGEEKNKKNLVNFLDAVLSEQYGFHVNNVSYLNSEVSSEQRLPFKRKRKGAKAKNRLPQDLEPNKGVRFDVYAVDNNGNHLIIEMQMGESNEQFFDRSVYYCARALGVQQKIGVRKYNLSPVILIGLLRHPLIPDSEKKPLCLEFDLVDKAKYPIFAHKNLLRLIFYQLEYLEYKRFEDCPNRTAQWLFLIKYLSTMDTGKLDVEKLTKEFQDFVASARYEQMNEAEQHAYDLACENYTNILDSFELKYKEGKAEGRAEGIAEGKAEGRAEGIIEGKAEAAKTMKAKGYLDADIAEITGLPLETIREL